MGHTVAAVSTVLAAFMGGLALGAAVAGRAAGRLTERHALRAYALIEVAIAGCALVVPVALSATRPVLSATYADGAGSWFGVTRVAVSLLILLAPTVAMGATVPLAMRWVLRRLDRAGADAGDLYAVNTIGAALGAGLAAFILLPGLGLRGSTLIAAGLNLVAAAGAWTIALGNAAPSPVGKRPQRTPISKSGSLGLATLALAITGFVALVSEVAWTRVLTLVIGPTTYAFGIMLIVFIAGLSGGSFAAARLAARVRHERQWLAMAQDGMLGF